MPSYAELSNLAAQAQTTQTEYYRRSFEVLKYLRTQLEQYMSAPANTVGFLPWSEQNGAFCTLEDAVFVKESQVSARLGVILDHNRSSSLSRLSVEVSCDGFESDRRPILAVGPMLTKIVLDLDDPQPASRFCELVSTKFRDQ